MQNKWTHSRIFLQLQARSLETQTHGVKMETRVNEEWGYKCHIISNAKDQLKHVVPYISYKKRKGAFLASMHRDCLVIFLKNQNTLLLLSYITVIITTCLLNVNLSLQLRFTAVITFVHSLHNQSMVTKIN